MKFSYAMNKTGEFISKNIFPIIRFLIFGIISLIFLGGLLAILALGAGFFTEYNFHFVEITKGFPEYFLYGLGAGAFAFLIFAIGSLLFAIRGKTFGIFVFLLGGISFLGFVFLSFSSYLTFQKGFSNSNVTTSTSSIFLPNEDISNYSIDLTSLNPKIEFLAYSIESKPTLEVLATGEGNIVTIDVITTVLGSQENFEDFEEELSKFKLERISDSDIRLTLENGRRFKESFPLVKFSQKIKITTPENKVFELTPETAKIFEDEIFVETEDKRRFDEKIIQYLLK